MPNQDDPKAWAPREQEMGMQWLEVGYAKPDRAFGVRIYEALAPGAVCELKVCDASRRWQSVWSGTAQTGQHPMQISFPITAFPVHHVRLVLDTNRVPGWNEIDAVELMGSTGSQFAASATASSSYADVMRSSK